MDVTPGCCLTLDAFMCTFFSRFVHVTGEEGPHMRYPKKQTKRVCPQSSHESRLAYAPLALRIGAVALLIKTLPDILNALTGLMKVLLGR